MKGKEWDRWSWNRGICVKVSPKFEPPDFPGHSRPAEELSPPREQLPLANNPCEADASQVNVLSHQDLLL